MFAAVVGVAFFIVGNICKRERNRSTVEAAFTQNSYQSNGNGVHGQFPLTSFVSHDSNRYQPHYSTSSHIDMDACEGNDNKTTEESNVTLLPPGTTPTPIGANIAQNTDPRVSFKMCDTLFSLRVFNL